MYPGRPITDTFGTFGITLDKIFTLYATRLRSTITTTTMGSLETILNWNNSVNGGSMKNGFS